MSLRRIKRQRLRKWAKETFDEAIKAVESIRDRQKADSKMPIFPILPPSR